MRINFNTTINSHMGYAEMARLIWPGMRDFDVRVGNIAMQQSSADFGKSGQEMAQAQGQHTKPDVTVVNMVPPVWESCWSGGLRIGYTTFEANRIPGKWTDIANSVDSVWVTSHWVRQVFLDSGVRVPIQVINPVATSSLSEPPHDGPFTFFSSFQWSARKNPEGLIKAFLCAFDGDRDVQLVLKTHIAGAQTDREQVDSNIRKIINSLPLRNPPRLRVVTGILDSRDVAELHRSSHAFVSLARGEGWGLPMWEAALAGRPVVTTNWSTPPEFLGADYPGLIDANLTPVSGMERNISPFFESGMMWAEPHLDRTIETMRWVKNNYDKALASAKRTHDDLLARYTVDACKASIVGGLRAK